MSNSNPIRPGVKLRGLAQDCIIRKYADVLKQIITNIFENGLIMAVRIHLNLGLLARRANVFLIIT